MWRKKFLFRVVHFFNPFGRWAVSYGHIMKFLPHCHYHHHHHYHNHMILIIITATVSTPDYAR